MKNLDRLAEQITDEYVRLAEANGLPYLFIDIGDLPKSINGVTNFDSGSPVQIIISSRLGLADAISTLRHEAAHVASGSRCGHNETFQYYARKFGARNTCRGMA